MTTYAFPSSYSAQRLEHNQLSFEVFRRGVGPGVIVMAEIPGPTPSVLAFADRLVAAGFHVAVPWLFGHPGRPPSALHMMTTAVKLCVRSEFGSILCESEAPLTDWLHALARELFANQGGIGVGVVGMCFTGKFALTTCLEPCVRAGIASQPSHPFSLSAGHRRSTGLPQGQLTRLGARARSGAVKVLGLRFSGDPLSPPGRFETLRSCLGDGFEGVEIDSSRGNPFAIRPLAHSVLTEDFVDVPGHPTALAMDRTLEFLRAQLKAPGSRQSGLRSAPG